MPPATGRRRRPSVRQCAQALAAARRRNAGIMLIYGAHLLRNGAALILERLMAQGWLTHLATNGAGTIHDWEYAWLGRSTESVRDGVATGTFGTWDETGRYIHLALLAGGLRDEGYGQSLGRFIAEDGVDLPEPAELRQAIQPRARPSADAGAGRSASGHADPRTDPGPSVVSHPWKQASILAQAFRHQRSRQRASGHRLRHHRQSSDVQRRRHRPGGRGRFSPVRRRCRDA